MLAYLERKHKSHLEIRIMNGMTGAVHCPNCKGWGTEKLPITKDFKTCPECQGYGTQIESEYYTLYFGMPSFVNFGKRKTMQIARVVAAMIFFAFIGGLIYFLIFLIQQIL